MKLLFVFIGALCISLMSQAEQSDFVPFQGGVYSGLTNTGTMQNGILVKSTENDIYSANVTITDNVVSVIAKVKSDEVVTETSMAFKFIDSSKFQIMTDKGHILAEGACAIGKTLYCIISFEQSSTKAELNFEVFEDGTFRSYEVRTSGSTKSISATVASPKVPRKRKNRDPYAHLIDYGATGDAVARLMSSDYRTFCSGSLIAPNIILSNRHCIEGNTGIIYAVLGQDQVKGDIAYVSRIVTPDMPRTLYNMTTPTGQHSDLFLSDPPKAVAKDLVLLVLDHKVTRVKPIKILSPRITTRAAAKWPLRIIGYPGDYAQLDSRNLPMPLSNLRTCHMLNVLEDQRVLETNCIAFPGNSGGPVVTTIDGTDYIVGSASTIMRGKSITYFTSVIVPEVAVWINSVIEIENRAPMIEKEEAQEVLVSK